MAWTALIIGVVSLVLMAVTALVDRRRTRADQRWKAFIEETSRMSGDELWKAYRIRGGHRE